MKKPFALFCSSLLLFVLVFGCFPLSAFAAVDPAFSVPSVLLADHLNPSSVFSLYSKNNVTVGVTVTTERMTGSAVACSYGDTYLVLCDSRPSSYWLNVYDDGVFSTNVNSYNTITVDGVSYYQFEVAISGSPTWLCRNFSTYDAALAACVSALDYSPPSPDPNSPTSFSIVVEPGYALVIDSSQGFQAQFDAFMPSKNVLEVFYSEFGSRWWPSSPVKYAVSGSSFNLAVGSTLPPSGSSFIPWLRVGTDVFGQTKQAHWSTAVLAPHFILYNPYLYLYSGPLYDSHGDFNNTPVTVTITDISPGWSYTLYELSDRIVQGITSSTLESTVTKVLEMNPDFYGGFVDSSGNPTSPKPGGALATDNAQEVTLNNIVADLDNFFRGTWDHVRNLINVLGDFPAYIVQLYSWLPAEYRAVIFAGFGLSMVVGVLKVML